MLITSCISALFLLAFLVAKFCSFVTRKPLVKSKLLRLMFSIMPSNNETMVTLLQLFPSLHSIPTIAISVLSLLFFAWIMNSHARNNENKSKPAPPEARGAWPVIGHLHLLGSSGLPHRVLSDMADKYGPIFIIRNGVRKALIISSWEMVKECLISNDKVLAARPKLVATEIMGYDGANFAFAPYGEYWRSIRRIITVQLLSNHRIDKMSYVWKEATDICMGKLYEYWCKNKNSGSGVALVDLKNWFVELSMSIIVRIVLGKNYLGCGVDTMHLYKTMGGFLDGAGSYPIGDALPFLRWLDLGGQEAAMKKTAKEIDNLLDGWLAERKQKRSSGNTKDGKDFMDVMLSVLDESQDVNGSGFDADKISKATCLMVFAAGSGTSSVFLTWAVSLLLNNPHVLKKAQDELDVHVGKGRQVSDSDIPNLVYLQAIVKETMRMYPPAPLGGPREFLEDCTIAGYHVQKGTRLIFNLSKLHRDPRVWEDPMEFRPERFLTTHKDVDVKGQHFELIPFGAGRRICPGMSFGLRSAHLFLAAFLHSFEFSTPSDAPIDMTESPGATNLKASPLNVLIAPRLPADLYDRAGLAVQ